MQKNDRVRWADGSLGTVSSVSEFGYAVLWDDGRCGTFDNATDEILLPKPAAMSQQEAFDIVWNHFVVQGNPRALNDDGACAYRGTGGCKCAFGILIPDAVYKPWMEGISSGILFLDLPLDQFSDAVDTWLRFIDAPEWEAWRSYVHEVFADPILQDLIIELQVAHDYSFDSEIFKKNLLKIAEEFRLQIPATLYRYRPPSTDNRSPL